MRLEALGHFKTEDGVILLPVPQSGFEEAYLKVRSKENRLYSHAEARALPFISKMHPHHREWRLRAASLKRFEKYLSRKQGPLELLDLGCGNGWFSTQLAKRHHHTFCCVDRNLRELKQGARLFGGDCLRFIRGDVLDDRFPDAAFDLIVLNGTIQYFADLGKLIGGLRRLLKRAGEIHIMDSPWYSANNLEAARQRTMQYYDALGVPEMSQWYHHHCLNGLTGCRRRVLWNPDSLSNRLVSFVGRTGLGFPWIMLQDDSGA